MAGTAEQRAHDLQPASKRLKDQKEHVGQKLSKMEMKTGVEIAVGVVTAIAAVAMAWYAYKLEEVSREATKLNREAFVLRNTPRISVANWEVDVHSATEIGYRGEVVENAGAGANVEQVETYLTMGDRLATNGLYQKLKIDPPYEIHKQGDAYTFEHERITLKWDEGIEDTGRSVYIYVRTTYQGVTTGERRSRVDAAAITLDARGGARVKRFLKPPPRTVEQLFQGAKEKHETHRR